MTKISKNRKTALSLLDRSSFYSLEKSFELVKKMAFTKFKQFESIDIAVKLGIDPRKSDQMVRSSVLLPAGTGKNVRIAVFAEGDLAIIAKNAGADLVGMEDLVTQIKSGILDFDVVVATPDAMKVVGKLGMILGPRGLMPNPKVGTVTTEIEKTIKNIKLGQISYRSDKTGIVHCKIGNVSFAVKDLSSNVNALVIDLKKRRPINAKGIYIKKMVISSTMGPGVNVDINTLV